MSPIYDAVIVGAGHNGLVCAAYLARAGLKVLLLERRGIVGGACVTEEVWPGYRISTAAYLMSLLQPRIIRDLELRSFGLTVLPTDSLFVPFPDGRYLVFSHDLRRTCQHVARFSKKDAEAYPVFEGSVRDVAMFVRDLLWVTPPNPASRHARDLATLAWLLWRVRKLNKKVYQLIELMTHSVSDFLDRHFECGELKAALALGGLSGVFAGPKTPGTAFGLVHHLAREDDGLGGWGFIRGGMGGISQALARSAQGFGATIRANAEVVEISVRDGQATGVVLRSGEAIQSRLVVSNADPKRTFLHLVPSEELPPDFLREVRAIKAHSTAFKINLALDELPRYTSFDPDAVGASHATYVHISPSIEYLEQAYDDAKYGRPSAQPWLSAVIPTVADPDLAPKGRHILNVFGAHAPYTLRNGSWETERGRFGGTVLSTLAEYAPNLKNAVVHSQILVPPDMEAIFGLTEGHILHGAQSLDQMFFLRPVAGYANYRTPIGDLYSCGLVRTREVG